MGRFGYAALAALVLGACATTYGRGGLLGGYSDKQIEPGLWRVRATTNGYSREYSALAMALYRSAELSRDAGFDHFQVVRSNHHLLGLVAGGTWYSSGGGENAMLRIRGTHDANAPIACETERSNCRTYSVQEVLVQIGPLINRRR